MDISQVTDYLLVGAEPKADCVDELHNRDVRLIISMIGARHPPEVLAQPPCRLLWLQTFDTFLTPIPIRQLIRGVKRALPIIQAGHRVFVFCAQGRHRSVAMGAAILIAMGHSAHEAMRLIDSQRETADSQAWHIRRQILRFEWQWQSKGNNPPKIYDQLYESYCESIAALVSRIVLRLRLDRGPLAKHL